MPNSESKPRATLQQFIEGHHQLLSAFGIFAALTLFSQSFLVGSIGIFVSFMFLACLSLLYFELSSSFVEEEESTEILWWFQMAFSFAGLGIFCFWLVRLRQYDEKFFYFFLTFVITFVLMDLIRKILMKSGVYDSSVWQRINTTRRKLFIFFWGPLLLLLFLGINITLTHFGPLIVDPIVKTLGQSISR